MDPVTELVGHRNVVRQRLNQRRLWAVSLTSLTALFAAGCQGSDTSNRDQSIKIVREVILQGIRGQPNAIARMPDRKLVVAGVRGVAWAVGTSEDGRVLWQFEEPEDKKIETLYQSEYDTVVPLANGNVLLCGRMSTRESLAGLGLITILEPDGRLVEQRVLRPNDDKKFYMARLRCLPWGEGIAALGGAVGGGESVGWLLKLDRNGAKEWERVGVAMGGTVSETHDHGFLFARPDEGNGRTFTRLTRVNQNDDVVAQRVIDSSGIGFLRSIAPEAKEKIILYTPTQTMLYTLNDQLADLERPRSIAQVEIDHGVGYVLPDDSLALFGSFHERSYLAGIAWVSASGGLVSSVVLEQHPDSVFVRAATPLSPSEFVAVREKVSVGSAVVLTWVSFE
jgi:hypothetical protein